MRETEYAYAVAYTRTLENKMLTKADLEMLLNASSEGNALKYLMDKGYGNDNANAEPGAEGLLRKELQYTWGEVRNACPKEAPIEILLYQNDFHNLKTILKAVFSGAEYKDLMLDPCTIEPKIIYDAVFTDQMERLPDILQRPAIEAYQILSQTNDGQHAEIVIDKASFLVMQKTAEQSKNTFLIGWADLNIAVIDMKIALRGALSGKSKDFLYHAMIPCAQINIGDLSDAAGQNVAAVWDVFSQSGFREAASAAQESVSTFEKWCDNKRMSYLKTVRYKTFGFEPLLGFLIGKQVEVQAVRIILSGLRSEVPTGALRERLRDLYV